MVLLPGLDDTDAILSGLLGLVGDASRDGDVAAGSNDVRPMTPSIPRIYTYPALYTWTSKRKA